MNTKRIDRIAAILLPDNHALMEAIADKVTRANARGNISAVRFWQAVFKRACELGRHTGIDSMSEYNLWMTLCMYASGYINLTEEELEEQRKAMAEYDEEEEWNQERQHSTERDVEFWPDHIPF